MPEDADKLIKSVNERLANAKETGEIERLVDLRGMILRQNSTLDPLQAIESRIAL